MQVVQFTSQKAGQSASRRPFAPGRLGWFALALGLTLVLPAVAKAQRSTPSDADIKRYLGLPADYKNKDAYKKLKEGFNAFFNNQPNTAMDQFDAARKSDGSLPPGRVEMAQLYAAVNRVDLARSELEQAATDDPDSPDVYLLLGHLGLREGRLCDAQLEFKAAEAAEKAKSVDPASDDYKFFARKLYLGLTTIAEQRRNWTQAKAFAEIWLANTEPEKGKELTTQEQKDQQALALQRLSQAEFFLDDVKGAEENLTKAAHLNKELPNPKTQMGWFATQEASLKAAGDRENDDYKRLMKDAKQYMEDAIASATGDEAKARAEGAYSQWLLQENKIDEAEEHANRALQLDPKSDAYKRVVALLDLHRKNFSEAEKYFREMYAKSPSDFFATNNLALALVGLGGEEHLRMAEELATVNAKANPKSAEALSTLGWVYFNQNRINEADQILSQVLQGSKQGISPDTAYYLAKVLARGGRLDQAAGMLQKAVSVPGPFTYREEATGWLKQLVGSGVNPTTSEPKTVPTGARSEGESTPPKTTPSRNAPARGNQPK
jgi:tetratricopeptide (TPR) repeat protein